MLSLLPCLVIALVIINFAAFANGQSLRGVCENSSTKLSFRVDSAVLSKACASGAKSVKALIFMKSVADVKSLKFSSNSRSVKRSETKAFLEEHAQRTQHRLAEVLSTLGVSFKQFWIVNALRIDELSPSVLSTLAEKFADEDLFSVEEIKVVNRIKPVERDIKQDSSSLAWNIVKIQADKCWQQGVNGTGVVIATIDGGVRYTHVALRDSYRGMVSAGRSYTYNHDYNWIDYAYGDSAPSDNEGHGTNVAGICSASADSGVGVAPGSKWITAKVFNYAGASTDDALIESTQWVMCPTPVGKTTPEDCSKGADVVSCSWGFASTYAPSFIQYVAAWTAADLIPVFAVGNYGPDCSTIAAPSDFSGVIGVGATDQKDNILGFSSRGPVATKTGYSTYVPAVVAPGSSIYGPACDSDSGYTGFSGTSQAAPHVAGVMALLRQANPTASVSDLYNALYSSADKVDLKAPPSSDEMCGGIMWNVFPNYIYGYGRLDALAAITAAQK